MSNEALYEVDIDQEKVLFDNEWLGRQELADKIKHMIESQDFRISAAGNALEFLVNAVSNARRIEIKLSATDADRLDRYAERARVKPPAFARQAIQAYLAAQPPLENAGQTVPTQQPQPQPQPVVTTITTEPAKPGEEAEAVELTDRKPVEGSKAGEIGDSWFKKS